MIAELLLLLGAGKVLNDVCRPVTRVGVRCTLCGWCYQDPDVRDAFDRVDDAKCARVMELHFRDRHPGLTTEELQR